MADLASEVTVESVEAHLIGRPAGLLSNGNSDTAALFEALVRGVTAEVAPLVGTDPPPGTRRELAVWAISIGVAAHLEASLWPEQQGPGDLGRANVLTDKFERMLMRLESLPTDTGETGQAAAARPRGSFPPPPPCYPDPADRWSRHNLREW